MKYNTEWSVSTRIAPLQEPCSSCVHMCLDSYTVTRTPLFSLPMHFEHNDFPRRFTLATLKHTSHQRTPNLNLKFFLTCYMINKIHNYVQRTQCFLRFRGYTTRASQITLANNRTILQKSLPPFSLVRLNYKFR